MPNPESFFTDADLVNLTEIVDVQTSLGTIFTINSPGTISAIRWWYPTVAPSGPVLARLYNAAGTLLASKAAFDTTTLGAWNLATFTTAQAVAAGTYRAVVVSPNRRVESSGPLFNFTSYTRRNLIMGPSRADAGDVFPQWPGFGGTYFVDVVFTPTGRKWVAKVGRHVQVFVPKTVGGNAQYQKVRPAVITALGAGTLISCRVLHTGETYTNIDMRQDPNEKLTVVKYIPA